MMADRILQCIFNVNTVSICSGIPAEFSYGAFNPARSFVNNNLYRRLWQLHLSQNSM